MAPAPLFRAHRLEKALNTPARIYYKYAGVPRLGRQAQHRRAAGVYNAVEGTRRLPAETGAGQWGSALAFASAQFGLECEVWMVRAS